MEELTRTVKSAVAFLLLIILGRMLYDMLRSSYNSKSTPQWGLLGVVITLISLVVMLLFESYGLDLPLWVHVWHIVNLAACAVALYSVVLEVRKDD